MENGEQVATTSYWVIFHGSYGDVEFPEGNWKKDVQDLAKHVDMSPEYG
jgi:hypothetical protein